MPPRSTKRYPTRQPAEMFPEWVGKRKKCPKCEKTKDVLEDFGLRQQRGKTLASSWCRVCRSASTPRLHLQSPPTDRSHE
jgi:hypothetical protein